MSFISPDDSPIPNIQASLQKDIHNIIDEYVSNSIPLYLLHLPDMTLMRRDQVKKIIAPLIKGVEKKYQGKRVKFEAEVRKDVRNVVGYAIFSHRWLDEGEPSFNDLMNPTEELWETEGYKKLEGFGEKAKDLFGCTWAWSDTCCIDKSSSAGLEESIRSMFTWYKNAKVCIAYLADVTGAGDWGKSQWFGRGWTLQELLAPSHLKFFVKGWKPLTEDKSNPSNNDKEVEAVVQSIRSVTGIPVEDIKNFEPSTERVREKLSWASKRKTTRVEDMAYSLIGILDVSLPISYGEGKRAFYRLQVEIIRNTGDWGMFLWKGEPSIYNSAMAEGPECFSASPMDVKAITNIQLAVAADVSSDDVWSDWQQFSSSNYICGDQMAVLQFNDARSIVFQRPGRLHLTDERDFRDKAKGGEIFIVKEQINEVNLVIDQSGDGTDKVDISKIFKFNSPTENQEGEGTDAGSDADSDSWDEQYEYESDSSAENEDDDDDDDDDESEWDSDDELKWNVKEKGMWGEHDEDDEDVTTVVTHFLNGKVEGVDDEVNEEGNRVGLMDFNPASGQMPIATDRHRNLLEFRVTENSFFTSRTAENSRFHIVHNKQQNSFILSEDENENRLTLSVVCGDLATDLAIVAGIGSALVSDLAKGLSVDNKEHLAQHARGHIIDAVDVAIEKAAQKIDASVKVLRDVDDAAQKLGGCDAKVIRHVRKGAKSYFKGISIPSWVLDALQKRNMTTTNAQTSFELTQRGLKLTLPVLELGIGPAEKKVDGNTQAIEEKQDGADKKEKFYSYTLRAPLLEPIQVRTEEELIDPDTLKLVILDCKESAGFNVLNDLVTRKEYLHQALLLRTLRSDTNQYRKVMTEDIIQVQRHYYTREIYAAALRTIYVK